MGGGKNLLVIYQISCYLCGKILETVFLRMVCIALNKPYKLSVNVNGLKENCNCLIYKLFYRLAGLEGMYLYQLYAVKSD